MRNSTIEVRIERDHGTNIAVEIDPQKTKIEATDPYSQAEIQVDFDYEHRREIIEEDVGMTPGDRMSGSETGTSRFYDWTLIYRNDGDLEQKGNISFSEAKKFVREIDEELKDEGSTHHFS